MKQCENCGGALDDKGKCMACGKINEFKLDSNDGQVIYGLPEEFIDMFNKIKVPLEEELEKIKTEIDTARFIDKDTKLCKNANASGLEVAMQIIDNHISELKGENK